jgi:NADH:ubiquinone reductase (H+-translocating)
MSAAAAGRGDARREGPATCRQAVRQARRPAEHLGGTPRAYSYRTRGQMATLGSRHGIALVGGLHVKGVLGWLIARG